MHVSFPPNMFSMFFFEICKSSVLFKHILETYYCPFGQNKIRGSRVVSDGAQTLWASRCMLQKNAHEISASEVPMVKSYDVLKLGYLCWENDKKPFSSIKPGYLLTSCGDMVCQKVKELTRTFQGNVVGFCGSSMVLRYDGCHVMQQLFAHLFGFLPMAKSANPQVINLYLLMVDGY